MEYKQLLNIQLWKNLTYFNLYKWETETNEEICQVDWNNNQICYKLLSFTTYECVLLYMNIERETRGYPLS
jgi:hypothetical protein